MACISFNSKSEQMTSIQVNHQTLSTLPALDQGIHDLQEDIAIVLYHGLIIGIVTNQRILDIAVNLIKLVIAGSMYTYLKETVLVQSASIQHSFCIFVIHSPSKAKIRKIHAKEGV